MKKTIDFIKEMLKTKRRRAILELGFWIIFFIVIFSMVGGADRDYYKSYNEKVNKSSEKITDNPIDNIKKLNSYEFTYDIEAIDKNGTYTYKVEGTFFKDKYFATILNKEYIITDDTFYIVDMDNKTLTKPVSNNPNALYNLLDIRLLTNNNLNTLISSSEEIESITYKDKSKVIKYKYVNYENKSILFECNIKDNIFNEIKVDLTNYFDRKFDSFKVIITYDNINNIIEYNKNYDNYEIIGE